MGREVQIAAFAFPSWYLCDSLKFCFVNSCFHSSWDEQMWHIGCIDSSHIFFNVVTYISSLTVEMWLMLLWLYLEIFLVLKRKNAATDNVDTGEEKLLEWNATWKVNFIIGEHARFFVFIIITCEGQWQLHKQCICMYSLLPLHTFNLFVVLRKSCATIRTELNNPLSTKIKEKLHVITKRWNLSEFSVKYSFSPLKTWMETCQDNEFEWAWILALFIKNS